MPGQQGNFIGNSDYDWFLQTNPQARSSGTVVLWLRWEVLGGTSSVNFFVRRQFFHPHTFLLTETDGEGLDETFSTGSRGSSEIQDGTERHMRRIIGKWRGVPLLIA